MNQEDSITCCKCHKTFAKKKKENVVQVGNLCPQTGQDTRETQHNPHDFRCSQCWLICPDCWESTHEVGY